MNKLNLKFNLDEPADDQEFYFGEVLVRGWVIHSDGELSIAAKLGDSSWIDIPHGKPRTDVAIVHSGNPNALHSGFSGRIPTSHLQGHEQDFTLQIRSATNDTIEIRRKIKIAASSQLKREAFFSSSKDSVHVKLDDPSEGNVALRGSILKVAGWAIARTGIRKIEIWLDGNGPYLAHYGIMREDIGALYSDYPDTFHAGFLWAGKTDFLHPGAHSLKIISTSNTGESAQITESFEIDPRSDYDHWSSLNKHTGNELLNLLEHTNTLSRTPKISIVTPVFKTPESFLTKCVESVKRQVYPNWQLVLVDDGSNDPRLTALLAKLSAGDQRILVETLPSNLGIAAATNAGIELCSGEYIGLLDHDDEISPDALLSAVQALAQDPSTDVFYSDEDKLDEGGGHRDPFFKPDWSPDLLLSMNYVCHFLVCRRTLLQELGGLRLGFDGSQDFDLILRLSERTSKIRRIPKILYHWRSHENSTAAVRDQKPAASEAGRRALEQHLTRKGVVEARVEEIGICRYRVKYKIIGEPEVAIIIPTGGSPTLETALNSVLSSSTYKNFRIVVVDNSRHGVSDIVATFMGGPQPVELLNCRNLPFNFSRLCNKAAQATTSEYLLFLNDDTSVITPDWIESMLEHAQRESVGAVGSLLLFPNGTIQHAGVVNGLFEFAGHCFRGLPNSPFYFDFSHLIRNCSGVTGACLMTKRDMFDSVGGFDEPNLPTCFQDVDLCLKMLDKGYRIVYTPFARLFHYESFSKKAVADLPELKYMKQRWAHYINDDPYYNPNLTRCAEDYSLRYDQLFLNKQNGSAQLPPAPLRTTAAKKLERLREVKFYASAAQHAAADARGLAQSIVSWDVAGPEKVQIRVGSPTGTIFVEGRPSGSATTGPWVSPGIVLYLLDSTEGGSGSPDKVLSVLRL